MRRQLLSLFTCSILAGCQLAPPATEQPSEQPAPAEQATEPGWQLVWQDEFDGNSIDSTKWGFEQNCQGGGNNELQCYTNRRENAYVENGILHIVARKETYTGAALNEDDPAHSPHQRKTQPYTSARLRSKGKGDWLYGRFEIRAKLPHGQGSWPAIWMLPTDWHYGSWPLSGEIDIMEAVNLGTISDEPSALADERERRVHGTLHYGKLPPDNVYSGKSYKLRDGKSPSDAFYTYAIEWEAGEIRWYVDDVLYATQRSSDWYTAASYSRDDIGPHAPFDQRFHLLLNLAVGGNWAGNVNEKGVDASAYPQSLQIDYVRVYQR
ncbi:family 16 glycosylhydrolase [Rheinheimera aquimaris]|uniref:glycoside hydrolase family 16 protein n=1 Tax=Rheinheimera aquimaris TaxID=412437 RepID=UPI001E5B0DDD|nr:glycoside hydrolase family 16 protein [Rheinheimera aquimaris]MCD1596791.1 glycoside hydrolase family 16 protein [Rheinheimera aquimaris]